MLQRQFFQFPLGRDTADFVWTSGRLWEVKNNRKYYTVISKSGRLREVVAEEMWTLSRGSKGSGLTRKLSVFRKSGRLREVVAKGGSTVLLKGQVYMKRLESSPQS